MLHRSKERSVLTDPLRKVSLFSACSDNELTQIASLLTEVRVPAGRVLTREGGLGQEFVVITSGSARVMVGDTSVATLGGGDFYGEISLLDIGPRTATVIAETDLVAQVAGRSEFASLLDASPSLSRAILTGLARRLREADRQLVNA